MGVRDDFGGDRTAYQELIQTAKLDGEALEFFPQACYGNIELFAVFSHSTAGNVVAPLVKDLMKLLVG